MFAARDLTDPVAVALAQRGVQALAEMPPELAGLPRSEVALLPFGLVGVPALRALFNPDGTPDLPDLKLVAAPLDAPLLDTLMPELERRGHGVIMTMGKGGVGKTSVAVAIAVELARRGHPVHLTTTDPAAHVQEALGGPVAGIRVSRIDPVAETRAYADEVMRTAGARHDTAGRRMDRATLRLTGRIR